MAKEHKYEFHLINGTRTNAKVDDIDLISTDPFGRPSIRIINLDIDGKSYSQTFIPHCMIVKLEREI